MIDDLIKKVWENPRFHEISEKIELAWLSKELSVEANRFDDHRSALQVSRASAILACSSLAEHKQAAFRTATQTFELFGDAVFPLSQVLRVTLSRLGNLPSINTRALVAEALPNLPWILAAEEFDVEAKQSIHVGDMKLRLTQFQYDLWSRLSKGERIALSAPTSAGKSFVLQAYIRKVFDELPHSEILYLVPTRALISQVSQDFLASFQDMEVGAPQINTIPFEEGVPLPAGSLYIFTQERTQLMLQSHKDFSPEIIIVDEAQSITDGSRGIILQSALDELLQRKRKVQILFASPTIRNLDIFGQLFGLKNVVPFRSNEPTVSQNFINVKIEAPKKGLIVLSTFGDGTRELVEVGRKALNQTLASRKDKLVHIPLLMEGAGASIIYANGAAEAEVIALQLADKLGGRDVSQERRELADLSAEVVHQKYALAECVLKGVGFHYSNIPTVLRLAIEKAFKEGHIDFLVSTSTLLQGVNLPAKHIFLCRPEKGRSNPIESTDFWNLSGRAGRLMREFHGNIFLIDYDNWTKKPLSGPKDNVIKPAIGVTVTEHFEMLVRTIRDKQGLLREKNQIDLDSSFLKVFSEFRADKLPTMLSRIGVAEGSATSLELLNALRSLEDEISLPEEVLKRSANISPHRQQALYQHLSNHLNSTTREGALRLLPAHPREPDAYKSYEAILKLCHEILLSAAPTSKTHRFHALLALRWMQGWPLPRIIQTQIDLNPEKPTRNVIRDTLNVIESSIRFQSAQMFTCYNSILVYCLDKHGYVDLASAVPGIPLFLEVGASDQTMISFLSLGLSRVVATKLNEIAPDKNLSPTGARRWLAARTFDSLGLSPLLAEEVRALLAEEG